MVPLVKTTVAPCTKFVPVITIGVPPASEAEVGATDVVVGAGKTTGAWPLSRRATICMTALPDVKVAPAW